MRRSLEMHSAQSPRMCIEGDGALHQIAFEATRTNHLSTKPPRKGASLVRDQLQLDAIGAGEMKLMKDHGSASFNVSCRRFSIVRNPQRRCLYKCRQRQSSHFPTSSVGSAYPSFPHVSRCIEASRHKQSLDGTYRNPDSIEHQNRVPRCRSTLTSDRDSGIDLRRFRLMLPWDYRGFSRSVVP